jgi:hypothetical protein
MVGCMPNGMATSLILRFARESRRFIVGSGIRNARRGI